LRVISAPASIDRASSMPRNSIDWCSAEEIKVPTNSVAPSVTSTLTHKGQRRNAWRSWIAPSDIHGQ